MLELLLLEAAAALLACVRRRLWRFHNIYYIYIYEIQMKS